MYLEIHIEKEHKEALNVLHVIEFQMSKTIDEDYILPVYVCASTCASSNPLCQGLCSHTKHSQGQTIWLQASGAFEQVLGCLRC